MNDELNVFQALSRRMSWLGQRQRVLAQNIANADTPGYVPQDMKDGPFARAVSRRLALVTPAATHARHLGAAGSKAQAFAVTDQPDTYEVKPSGNAVVLEQQLMKVTQTQMDHQTMSNLYRKHLRLFQIAIGGGK